MTDANANAEQPSTRRLIDCQDCQAGPDSGDVRTMSIGRDMAVTEIWHTDKCPTYTIERILLEAGAAKVKEQDAWAKDAFPAAHQRLQDAAAIIPADSAAAPFVTALLELVQAQADDTGRFVTLPTWTEILDRNIPPQDPT
ncbi:hypothetical protein [Kitasatospora sp. GP82]|uniref:hypothetical protein n=1 Tax=Kitasatospora sp. GP82 TaxID=3035089 RepID=UPI0024730758|nr:hypothetical protein [Kitasatospora sp. GP82]MDH6130023.1 hypothetical protein [Kitasatospora sp. GP82]